MRKLLIPFLIVSLLVAITAYLNNTYQRHQREALREAQATAERQQQEQVGRASRDPGSTDHTPLSRDNRHRPER